MPKGRKGRRSSSKRVAKKTQKMMKSSCMYGGESAHYSGSNSGATGYGAAIFGDRGAQVTDGMGGNHIKMNDPAVAWKGGQRGGDATIVNIPDGSTGVTVTYNPLASVDTATPPDNQHGGSRGGSMLGAAIVPAALLAANQLYKPSRGNKMRGSRKTMKKYGKRRR